MANKIRVSRIKVHIIYKPEVSFLQIKKLNYIVNKCTWNQKTYLVTQTSGKELGLLFFVLFFHFFVQNVQASDI